MATPQFSRAVSLPARATRHASLRGELTRAFEGVDARQGDVRAFAWDDVTCIVRWKPTLRAAVSVDLRLRQGDRVAEQAVVLPDATMLARWCEHHVLFFAQGR